MVLLLHFVCSKAAEVWMLSGTAKNRKCYPLHDVFKDMQPIVRENLVSFHAVTGCDTCSSFTGHGKKTCWKVFKEQPLLLRGIGRDGDIADIEKFVCTLYGTPDKESVDAARVHLFGKAKQNLELLPPTKDALELHVKRANYQAKIWLKADIEQIVVEQPVETSAWIIKDGVLIPVWSRLPAIPEACAELIACGCKKKCKTARCRCLQNDLTASHHVHVTTTVALI